MSEAENGGRRDSYMEQENEWGQGLLDPAWEQQQKKVRLVASFYVLGQ